MQNRRFYRIVLTIVCFVFAGLNGYKIMLGNYSKMDVFLAIIFLVFGIMYLVMLLRKQDL